jgi:hypothetical protein
MHLDPAIICDIGPESGCGAMASGAASMVTLRHDLDSGQEYLFVVMRAGDA